MQLALFEINPASARVWDETGARSVPDRETVLILSTICSIAFRAQLRDWIRAPERFNGGPDLFESTHDGLRHTSISMVDMRSAARAGVALYAACGKLYVPRLMANVEACPECQDAGADLTSIAFDFLGLSRIVERAEGAADLHTSVRIYATLAWLRSHFGQRSESRAASERVLALMNSARRPATELRLYEIAACVNLLDGPAERDDILDARVAAARCLVELGPELDSLYEPLTQAEMWLALAKSGLLPIDGLTEDLAAERAINALNPGSPRSKPPANEPPST